LIMVGRYLQRMTNFYTDVMNQSILVCVVFFFILYSSFDFQNIFSVLVTSETVG
jgi:hypothetical protein